MFCFCATGQFDSIALCCSKWTWSGRGCVGGKRCFGYVKNEEWPDSPTHGRSRRSYWVCTYSAVSQGSYWWSDNGEENLLFQFTITPLVGLKLFLHALPPELVADGQQLSSEFYHCLYCICGSVIDTLRAHALSCKSNPDCSKRHYLIKDASWRTLQKSGFSIRRGAAYLIRSERVLEWPDLFLTIKEAVPYCCHLIPWYFILFCAASQCNCEIQPLSVPAVTGSCWFSSYSFVMPSVKYNPFLASQHKMRRCCAVKQNCDKWSGHKLQLLNLCENKKFIQQMIVSL